MINQIYFGEHGLHSVPHLTKPHATDIMVALLLAFRDAKSGRYGRYISAIFLAGANFWAILVHFWTILAILGHFWAIMVNFGSFLGYFG